MRNGRLTIVDHSFFCLIVIHKELISVSYIQKVYFDPGTYFHTTMFIFIGQFFSGIYYEMNVRYCNFAVSGR